MIEPSFHKHNVGQYLTSYNKQFNIVIAFYIQNNVALVSAGSLVVMRGGDVGATPQCF